MRSNLHALFRDPTSTAAKRLVSCGRLDQISLWPLSLSLEDEGILLEVIYPCTKIRMRRYPRILLTDSPRIWIPGE